MYEWWKQIESRIYYINYNNSLMSCTHDNDDNDHDDIVFEDHLSFSLYI